MIAIQKRLMVYCELTESLLFAPVLMAVTTGLRRGEILALRWKDVNFDEGRITVNQSLEQIAKEIRFKSPKTERSRRQAPLPWRRARWTRRSSRTS